MPSLGVSTEADDGMGEKVPLAELLHVGHKSQTIVFVLFGSEVVAGGLQAQKMIEVTLMMHLPCDLARFTFIHMVADS